MKHVTAGDILGGIEGWDCYTAAEEYGIVDDAAVDRALEVLKVEPMDGAGGVRFRLTTRTPPPA